MSTRYSESQARATFTLCRAQVQLRAFGCKRVPHQFANEKRLEGTKLITRSAMLYSQQVIGYIRELDIYRAATWGGSHFMAHLCRQLNGEYNWFTFIPLCATITSYANDSYNLVPNLKTTMLNL